LLDRGMSSTFQLVLHVERHHCWNFSAAAAAASPLSSHQSPGHYRKSRKIWSDTLPLAHTWAARSMAMSASFCACAAADAILTTTFCQK